MERVQCKLACKSNHYRLQDVDVPVRASPDTIRIRLNSLCAHVPDKVMTVQELLPPTAIPTRRSFERLSLGVVLL